MTVKDCDLVPYAMNRWIAAIMAICTNGWSAQRLKFVTVVRILPDHPQNLLMVC